jgi:deoxyinosine 3'endonuclease (endonuclease V)
VAYAHPYAAGIAHPYAHAGLAHPYAAAGVAHPYAHAGLVHPYAHAGLAHPYAAPAVVASAPAAREATLTTVKLNPGHAVAYRVD